MHIRPEFRQFIGSATWGPSKDYHQPTDQQLETNSFQLPVGEGLLGAISQSHLDLVNIGHNTDKFNALDPEVKAFAQSVAERRGTYAEIQAQGEQGKLAAIHMSNVNSAQNHLLSTLLGPFGVTLDLFADRLAAKVLGPQDEHLVSLAVRSGSEDMVSGDVYVITQRDYLGSPINGISGKPVARVSVDLSNGDAYIWPQEAVQAKA